MLYQDGAVSMCIKKLMDKMWMWPNTVGSTNLPASRCTAELWA